MPHDIVFVLKEQLDTDELRYALRSIEKNFPHRFVWFVGGQPEGFQPDRMLRHRQPPELNKWNRIKSSMLKVVEEPELSEEFFWFNDDFFVMKPFKGKFVNYADKSLTELIEQQRKSHKWLGPYARTLLKAREELKALKKPEVNFEVHMPMLFEKSKVAKAIMTCSSPQMRSIYGNVTGCKWKQHDDVKVYDLDEVPDDPDFLSTNDKTFTDGVVGAYIRAAFPTPSRFEVDPHV